MRNGSSAATGTMLSSRPRLVLQTKLMYCIRMMPEWASWESWVSCLANTHHQYKLFIVFGSVRSGRGRFRRIITEDRSLPACGPIAEQKSSRSKGGRVWPASDEACPGSPDSVFAPRPKSTAPPNLCRVRISGDRGDGCTVLSKGYAHHRPDGPSSHFDAQMQRLNWAGAKSVVLVVHPTLRTCTNKLRTVSSRSRPAPDSTSWSAVCPSDQTLPRSRAEILNRRGSSGTLAAIVSDGTSSLIRPASLNLSGQCTR
jgi:hypothetical protein